jgi:integrase
VRRTASDTFDTRGDAEGWLTDRRREIKGDDSVPPVVKKAAAITLERYANAWLMDRQLKPRTRTHYRWLLDSRVLPALGSVPVKSITPATIRTWHAGMDAAPTARAHAHGLLKSIMATAVEDEIIGANPCRIRGASKVKRAREIRPATLDELAVITEAMPARLQLLVPLTAWCALRFGEVTELRRKDIDLKRGVLHIRRGVVYNDGAFIVDTPKTVAGKRTVAIPPHLHAMITRHLHDHAQIGKEGLLFYGVKGGQLSHSSLLWQFNQAAERAGREDLTPHALRHTGAVLAAQSGATLKELMARLGHTTPDMAMRYQHASADRDLVIAHALSKLANGGSS